jgi:sulfatase maturation enzyme AslB (radical SAM superfamily)
MSSDRDYDRLSHINRGIGDRDNVERILKKSLSSNDIYFRDFYFVSSNSTDDYATKLTNEKWKEFGIISDEFDNSYTDDLSTIHLLQLEQEIMNIIHKDDKDFLLVVIFFTIIHDIYVQFSEDLTEHTDELKSSLIKSIRVSLDSINSAPPQFLLDSSYLLNFWV